MNALTIWVLWQDMCHEIGLTAWLEAQYPGNRQQVSTRTATVAMILSGLEFSNRQLYLVQ